jgi:hypothetical protein
MNFQLTIECDNDAFQPDYNAEIARLLRAAADKVERSGANFGSLMDANGNRVGTFGTDND